MKGTVYQHLHNKAISEDEGRGLTWSIFMCCKKKVAVGQDRSSILNTERKRAYPEQVANNRVLVPECDLGVSVVLDETTGRG